MSVQVSERTGTELMRGPERTKSQPKSGKESPAPLSANPEFSRREHWSRRRWLIAVLLILGLQVGLIFVLSDRRPLHAGKANRPPTIRLAGLNVSGTEDLPVKAPLRLLLALNDPTLFALPHPENFSGPAWLQAAPVSTPPFNWSEEPRWLSLNSRELGTIFNQFTLTSQLGAEDILSAPETAVIGPRLLLGKSPGTASTLRIEGELARRKLLTATSLPSWSSSELLTNTVIQMLVDAKGLPVSVSLLRASPLRPGSGLDEADKKAIELAWSARFEPLPGIETKSAAAPIEHFTLGKLIFEWQMKDE